MPTFEMRGNAWAEAMNRARDALKSALPHIDVALEALRKHLGRE